MCLGTGDFLRPQGAIPPGLYPLRGGWVYCLAAEAPQKGECRRGRRYFGPCRTRVGFGPAPGPTLKTALCHIRALVGRNDKYRGSAGCASALEISSGLRGPYPQAYTPFRGAGFIAWRLMCPKKGNADGAEGIFGLAGRVWASALRLEPL